MAIPVVPKNYWRLNCWTYSDPCYCAFTCPYLDWKQRVYSTYKYYSHQVESHPLVGSCLQCQRRDCNLSQSNRQPFCTPFGLYRTMYWGYPDNGCQAASQCPPKKFVLRVKLMYELFLKTLDPHLILSRKKSQGTR